MCEQRFDGHSEQFDESPMVQRDENKTQTKTIPLLCLKNQTRMNADRPRLNTVKAMAFQITMR